MPLQAFTHSSLSERLNIINERSESRLISPYISTFNYQRLEYLGDPLLNFIIAKHFYLETAVQAEEWHKQFSSSQKLHELKTWFTGNTWLAYLGYENYYFYLKLSEGAV